MFMTEFVADYGLIVLFLVIALQAAGVAGLPGKTALIAAAILAADGRFAIWSVVAVAAFAAASGGYAGYGIGRSAGRRLLERPRVAARLERPLASAARFFEQHGAKAVFLARFLPGLKVVAGVAAGSFRMPWTTFALWHTLASLAFALVWGLTAYWVGRGAVELGERYGFVAAVTVTVLAAAAAVGYRLARHGRAGLPFRTAARP